MQPEDHPCGSCQFYQESVWQPVEGISLCTLIRSFSRRELATGDVLYHQGDESNGVYCVSAGLFAVRAFDSEGASTLLRLANPGDLVGYRAFLTGRPHRTEVQALLPSRICRVARRGADSVVEASHGVLTRLAQRCAYDLDACHERIQASARSKNRERLAEILTQLMIAHGAPHGEMLRMRLPISRRDLADMMGVQPETLSRLLGRLEKDGILRSSGRTIEMPLDAVHLEGSIAI